LRKKESVSWFDWFRDILPATCPMTSKTG